MTESLPNRLRQPVTEFPTWASVLRGGGSELGAYMARLPSVVQKVGGLLGPEEIDTEATEVLWRAYEWMIEKDDQDQYLYSVFWSMWRQRVRDLLRNYHRKLSRRRPVGLDPEEHRDYLVREYTPSRVNADVTARQDEWTPTDDIVLRDWLESLVPDHAEVARLMANGYAPAGIQEVLGLSRAEYYRIRDLLREQFIDMVDASAA